MSVLSRLFARQWGQSLVETALILPIMLTLTIGVIDVAFAFYAQVQVTNAAREGARAAARYEHRYTLSDSANRTAREAQGTTAARAAMGTLSGTPTVTYSYPDGVPSGATPGGQRLVVELQYPYQLPIVSSFGFEIDNLTLRPRTTMMIVNPSNGSAVPNCDTTDFTDDLGDDTTEDTEDGCDD